MIGQSVGWSVGLSYLFLYSTGRVADLTNQTATAVAIGKAHIVVLNSEGDVFTFGINNKVKTL